MYLGVLHCPSAPLPLCLGNGSACATLINTREPRTHDSHARTKTQRGVSRKEDKNANLTWYFQEEHFITESDAERLLDDDKRGTFVLRPDCTKGACALLLNA